MALELIIAGLSSMWDLITEFIILLLVIIYVAMFFTAQYFLIKGYSMLVKMTFTKVIALYDFLTKEKKAIEKFKDFFSTAFSRNEI